MISIQTRTRIQTTITNLTFIHSEFISPPIQVSNQCHHFHFHLINIILKCIRYAFHSEQSFIQEFQKQTIFIIISISKQYFLDLRSFYNYKLPYESVNLKFIRTPWLPFKQRPEVSLKFFFISVIYPTLFSPSFKISNMYNHCQYHISNIIFYNINNEIVQY